MAMKWYVVHTYSGHENKAKLSLQDRVRQAGLMPKFGDVLIPTDTVVELVKGQKRSTTRKFFPGYMFVQMVLDDRTFHLVKNTPKVTGFVGTTTRPSPLQDDEVKKILKKIGQEPPKVKVSFAKGERVKVVDGPFTDFIGVVDDINPEKGKVRVLVSFFGRETPVELDFLQVQRIV